MNDEIPYVRVGINYYREIRRPSIAGETLATLVKWSRDTIVHDHKKAYLSKVPKYLGFCCIPNHTDYQKVIGDFYNTYNKIGYFPTIEELTLSDLMQRCSLSLTFVRHIFGSQFELGLDYLKVLFLFPTQTLPIVCLVSKERSTGKSTFLKWLKEIFGLNMTYIKGDSFASQFNSDWASMLLVAIDEVFFDKKEITERLKYLSTTNKDKLEQKGKDREEIDFFAKFILCSNNEDNFIQIDEEEIRFWILKISSIKEENTNFLNGLIQEIPYFLRLLMDRPFVRQNSSRMWFKKEDLKTTALKRLLWKNNNRLEAKLIELFFELFEQTDEQAVSVIPQDVFQMVNRLHKSGFCSINDIRKVLKDVWKIEPQKNSLTYVRYTVDHAGGFYSGSAIGRYFSINRSFILEKFDELMR
jgi:hypothetical protein